MNTCHTCRQNTLCEFETSPDPMPKAITQQAQKNNIILIKFQIKNSERVKKFCLSCPCWNAKKQVCFKEYGTGCINYESVIKRQKS